MMQLITQYRNFNSPKN